MKSFNELINESEAPVLVDFYADWCGPCQMMVPVFKEVATKMDGRLKIIKIDVDKNPAVSSKYNIRSIPTMLLFHKGKILWQRAGAMSAGQLMQQLEPHLVSLQK